MADEVFQAQIERTLQYEGGYANNPNDPGGETKYGISKASYPAVDVKNLTPDQAIEIYRRDYWLKPGIAELPPYIAGKVFDLGVNMGTGSAIAILQHAIKDLAPHPEVTVDGVLGPITLTAARTSPQVQLLAAICREAADHYVAIVLNRPSSLQFLRGWLRRALS